MNFNPKTDSLFNLIIMLVSLALFWVWRVFYWFLAQLWPVCPLECKKLSGKLSSKHQVSQTEWEDENGRAKFRNHVMLYRPQSRLVSRNFQKAKHSRLSKACGVKGKDSILSFHFIVIVNTNSRLEIVYSFPRFPLQLQRPPANATESPRSRLSCGHLLLGILALIYHEWDY